MKKTLSLILSVVTALSLAACNLTPAATTEQSGTIATTVTTATTENPSAPSAATKESASKLLSAAIDKFFAADSMHAKTSATLTISSSGVSMETSAFKDFYGSALTTSPVWKSTSSTTALGNEEKGETYFAEGHYYVSKYGFNAKITRSEEADEKYGWKKTFEVFLEKLPSDVYVTYFKMNEDGSCEIKADTACKAVMFDEYLEGMEESVAGNKAEDATVTTEVPTETAHIIIDADGNITEYRASITLPLTLSSGAQSQNFLISAEIETTVENVGESITIDEPASLYDYVHTTAEKFEYTIAQTAYNEFLKHSDVAGELYSYIAVQIGTSVTEIEATGAFAGKDYRGETPVLYNRSKITMSSSPYPYHSEIYYADGYFYVKTSERTASSNETKKLKLTPEEYAELYGEGDGNDEIFTFFGGSAFSSAEIEYDSTTKMTNIYFNMNTSVFELLFGEDINSVQKLIVGNEYEIVSCDVSEAAVMLSISAEGELKCYAIAFYITIQFKIEGQVYTAYAYYYDYAEITQTENVTVPVPSNLDSYVSSSELA